MSGNTPALVTELDIVGFVGAGCKIMFILFILNFEIKHSLDRFLHNHLG